MGHSEPEAKLVLSLPVRGTQTGLEAKKLDPSLKLRRSFVSLRMTEAKGSG